MSYLFGSNVETLRMAVNNIVSNRLRAFLTMIGITIGVSSVVLLLSVGRAFENYVVGEFTAIGTNLVAVFGAEDDRGGFEDLTQSDLDALNDPLRVPDADFVTAFVDVSGPTVNYEERTTDPSIYGITQDYIRVERRDVVAGRYIDETDNEGVARVAVLGASTVENIFPPGVFPVGQSIRIDGIPFRVIGVMDRQGGLGFADLDNAIFVPMRTAQSRLASNRSVTGEGVVTQILLGARSDDAIEPMVEQITEVLREERDIDFAGEDTFTISTQDDLLDTFGGILSTLTYFLATISGISLIVGGIGIMNIMLVTVTERTKEIGLRKAVGAPKGIILFQFVTEAVMLSLMGGGAGILIAGLGSAAVSSLIPAFDVGLNVVSVLLAVGLSTIIGVSSGLYPAWRAANLNPIDALRYE
jgi:putative ABC transport system permease protein